MVTFCVGIIAGVGMCFMALAVIFAVAYAAAPK